MSRRIPYYRTSVTRPFYLDVSPDPDTLPSRLPTTHPDVTGPFPRYLWGQLPLSRFQGLPLTVYRTPLPPFDRKLSFTTLNPNESVNHNALQTSLGRFPGPSPDPRLLL